VASFGQEGTAGAESANCVTPTKLAGVPIAITQTGGCKIDQFLLGLPAYKRVQLSVVPQRRSDEVCPNKSTFFGWQHPENISLLDHIFMLRCGPERTMPYS
jgi:hypothetical protein